MDCSGQGQGEQHWLGWQLAACLYMSFGQGQAEQQVKFDAQSYIVTCIYIYTAVQVQDIPAIHPSLYTCIVELGSSLASVEPVVSTNWLWPMKSHGLPEPLPELLV